MSTKHHAEWLSLLEINGPFLSLPVLSRTFPQGLETVSTELRQDLRAAYEEWRDNQAGTRADDALHYAWVKWVLTDLLEMDEEMLQSSPTADSPYAVTVPEHGATLAPAFIVTDPPPPYGATAQRARLLVMVVPQAQKLEQALKGSHWSASPATRMQLLLHGTGVRLGLVTNGEQWLIVDAPKGGTTGFISWYSELWLEEPLTLQAFCSLFRAKRFFGVEDPATIEALLAASATDQHEVTDQLGYQVRHAVELLVQAMDLADRKSDGLLLAGIDNRELYEAAVVVMMRLVFLLTAEERGLLLLGDPLYDEHYALSTLQDQLRAIADQQGEEILGARYDAWQRLLALFRGVHGGIHHDRLQLPAYGGDLFDPKRYQFLEGRRVRANEPSRQDAKTQREEALGGFTQGVPALRETGQVEQWAPNQGSRQAAETQSGEEALGGFAAWRELPMEISNRTVLHLLEALQYLQLKVGNEKQAQRLSFRALDIEQIGMVYEGLLDHTAKRAGEPVLGLVGTKDKEPEIPLSALEEYISRQAAKPQRTTKDLGVFAPLRENESLLTFLQEETGRSGTALRNGLAAAPPDLYWADKLRVACNNDEALYQRVLPWHGLIRDDDYGRPVVIPGGSRYVTSGTARRASGAHYTPRSLGEPLVQHTLEPLVYHGPAEGKPRDQWTLRSPAELLALKICDMAMGSGALLVQACRYLADRLIEAVDESDGKNGSRKGAKTQREEEDLSGLAALRETENPEERLIFARRLVAQRCLYGVDKNPLAVEMAKLSLWLITLERGKPFTFVDHALRCGDSLIGVDLDQLRSWSLEPKGERRFGSISLDLDIGEMIRLRREIEAMPVLDIRDQEVKRDKLAKAQALANDLISAADELVAAYYNTLNQREQATLRAALLDARQHGSSIEQKWIEAAQLGDLQPFHWPLEFPEVFLGEGRSGFDGFVGNPPFVGGRRIREALGDRYRTYLDDAYLESKGNADLSAFFFLRGFSNLQRHGALGLIATNTIAQGDTRLTGLAKIEEDNGTIYRAINNMPWPGDAAVVVNVVHISKSAMQPPYHLDGKPETFISSQLDNRKVVGDPYTLQANSGKSFQGSLLRGMGFVLTPEEAEALIAEDIRNSEVVLPYINGQDLNSSPDQSASRWVINFRDWPLARAESYPAPFKILEERVYPERMGTAKDRKVYEKIWWQFWRPRAELYETIAPLQRVLVVGQTSKYRNFIFVPNQMVYDQKLIVFPTECYGHFLCLQSALHVEWALNRGSSLKQDPVYTPTDCYDTFSFPDVNESMKCIGVDFHEHRRQLMLAHQEGLTATYNRFHDPDESAADIVRLRQLHGEMDHGVAAAYGWQDLALDHAFHTTAQGLRYTISEAARRAVLGRLLALNHARYAEEVAAGLHGKGKQSARQAAKPPRKGDQQEKDDTGQLGLFGEDG